MQASAFPDENVTPEKNPQILQSQKHCDEEKTPVFPKGWQMGTRNLNQRLCFLYYSKSFSDLTIQLKNGREYKV